MTRGRVSHSIFPYGVISPDVVGNYQLSGYTDCFTECLNFRPKLVGGFEKRPGSFFAAELHSSDPQHEVEQFTLIPYTLENKSYVIEICRKSLPVHMNVRTADLNKKLVETSMPVFSCYFYRILDNRIERIDEYLPLYPELSWKESPGQDVFYIENLENLSYFQDGNSLILCGDGPLFVIRPSLEKEDVFYANNIGFTHPPMCPIKQNLSLQAAIFSAPEYFGPIPHEASRSLYLKLSEPEMILYPYVNKTDTNPEVNPKYYETSDNYNVHFIMNKEETENIKTGHDQTLPLDQIIPVFYTGHDYTIMSNLEYSLTSGPRAILDTDFPYWGDLGNVISVSFSGQNNERLTWFGRIIHIFPYSQGESNIFEDWEHAKLRPAQTQTESGYVPPDTPWKDVSSMTKPVSYSILVTFTPGKCPRGGDKYIQALPDFNELGTTKQFRGVKTYDWALGAINYRAFSDEVLADANVDESSPPWNKLCLKNRGMPKCYALYQQRLWLANTLLEPNMFWGSARSSNDYLDFTPGVNDGDSISFKIRDHTGNCSILWIVGFTKLLIGTSTGIFCTGSTSFSTETLTPGNISIVKISSVVPSDIQPIQCMDAVFFIDSSYSKVYEIIVDSNNQVKVNDISFLSSVLFEHGAVEHAYLTLPSRTYLSLLNNSSLACLSYQKNNNIAAWYSLKIAPSWEQSPLLKNLCPLSSKGEQHLFFSSERKVSSGMTKKYLEVITEKTTYSPNQLATSYLDFSRTLCFPLLSTKLIPPVRFRVAVEERDEGLFENDGILPIVLAYLEEDPQDGLKLLRLRLKNGGHIISSQRKGLFYYLTAITYNEDDDIVHYRISNPVSFFLSRSTVVLEPDDRGSSSDYILVKMSGDPQIGSVESGEKFAINQIQLDLYRKDAQGDFVLIPSEPFMDEDGADPQREVRMFHYEEDNGFVFLSTSAGNPLECPVYARKADFTEPKSYDAVNLKKFRVTLESTDFLTIIAEIENGNAQAFLNDDELHANGLRKLNIYTLREIFKNNLNFSLTEYNIPLLSWYSEGDSLLLKLDLFDDEPDEDIWNPLYESIEFDFIQEYGGIYTVYPCISILYDIDYLFDQDSKALEIDLDGGVFEKPGSVILDRDLEENPRKLYPLLEGSRIARYAAVAIIGIPYLSSATLVPLRTPSPAVGSVAGLMGFGATVVLDLYQSAEGSVGRSESTMYKIRYSNLTQQVIGAPSSTFSGIIVQELGGVDPLSTLDPQIRIDHNSGCYFCVRAITQDVSVQDGQPG